MSQEVCLHLGHLRHRNCVLRSATANCHSEPTAVCQGHLGDYAAATATAAAAYCASISHMFSISRKQEKRQKV